MFCFCCKNKIISNDRILECRCGRIYCEKEECWNEANDEYIEWDIDGTLRNKKGHLLIDNCDTCIIYYNDCKYCGIELCNKYECFLKEQNEDKDEEILRNIFYDENMFNIFINQQETIGCINTNKTLFDKTMSIIKNHADFFEKYGEKIFKLYYKNIEFHINFFTDETGQYLYYALVNGEEVSISCVGPF